MPFNTYAKTKPQVSYIVSLQLLSNFVLRYVVHVLLFSFFIRKTCPCNVYPLEPHFYTTKNGVCRGIPNFLIFAPKHRLWVLVRTASTRRFQLARTIYVLSKNKKNIKKIQLKIFNKAQRIPVYCMDKVS